MALLTKEQIDSLFALLDSELREQSQTGELYLVGGAVMCLVLEARASTRDIDAYFIPTEVVREAAHRVAQKENVPDSWLNDAVKGFLSAEGQYEPYLDLPNLKVYRARADYLLAMKCLAFRIGGEFHDESDIRYLLRYLNIETCKEALEVICQFYPVDRFPQKTFYALEEILS